MKNILIIWILLLCTLNNYSQNDIVRFSPEKPVNGGVLKLYYNSNHPDAKFNSKEDIYCVITIVSDKSFKSYKKILKLEKGADSLEGTFKLPDNAMIVYVNYITYSSNSLDNNSLKIELFNNKNNKIIDNYPGHSFREKWFFYPFIYSEDSTTIKITEEMKELKKFRRKDPVGTLYSQSYGYMLMGEETKARDIIKELLASYPDHKLTYSAMDSYNYLVYAGKIDSEEGKQEVKNLTEKMIANNTEKSFARLFLISQISDNIQTEIIEKICNSWLEEEPDNPLPILKLVTRYSKEATMFEKTVELCNTGLYHLAQNKFRKYLDLKGIYTKKYLSQLLYYKSQALFNINNLTEALINIQAAKSLLPKDGENNFLEGKIWIALGNYSEAERALLDAFKFGNTKAEDLLKEIYNIRDDSYKTFDEYLNAKLKTSQSSNPKPDNITMVQKPEPNYPDENDFQSLFPEPTDDVYADENILTSEDVEYNSEDDDIIIENHQDIVINTEEIIQDNAPSFIVKSLNDEELSLNDLKGKVVVLNFWGLGCGPCRAEIPELNKLVKKYADKDVVFIAFTPDKKKFVNEFLNKKGFNYLHVTDAKQQFKDFKVKFLPTHIIINQKGQVHNRKNGGGSEVIKSIDTQIRVLLLGL